MRLVGILFFLVLWLSAANAADKDCLPSGERADHFLIRQVGGGFADLTTDTQKKKPLQFLMEELVLVDGRKDAPGKWLDDIRDTKPPAPPDISPQLTTLTLYYDKATANAHWPAFEKRYFLTANYLKEKLGGQPPKIKKMPGPPSLTEWQKYEDGLSNTGNLYERIAETLMYADFLYSRGDLYSKGWAYFLLPKHSGLLELNDKTLQKYVAKEMVWPMLNADEGRFSREAWLFVVGGMEFRSKEDLGLDKWVVNHTNLAPQYKNVVLRTRGNYYTGSLSQKDDTGALFCHLAAWKLEDFDESNTRLIKTLLLRKHGQEKGTAYYRRFLECIAPVNKDNFVQKEYAALKSGKENPEKPESKTQNVQVGSTTDKAKKP